MAAAALMLSTVFVCSCTKSETFEDVPTPTDKKTVTFRCTGDFDISTQAFDSGTQRRKDAETDFSDRVTKEQNSAAEKSYSVTMSENKNLCVSASLRSKTRSLTADGKTMTDLWVLDYMGDELTQTIHQTSDDADFGAPSIELDYGIHTLYFIASRGQDATIDTDAHTITFGNVRDTFWKSLALTVTSSSDANRTVTLSRVVTKLTMVFSDMIPTGAATFNFTPALWQYSMDYTTGLPVSATPSQTISINIPSSNIGKSGIVASVYGFSGTDEWTTDISINCKTSEGAIIGQAEISDAPFKRNRQTVYTGPLFDKTRSMTLTLNDSWDDSYQATW